MHTRTTKVHPLHESRRSFLRWGIKSEAIAFRIGYIIIHGHRGASLLVAHLPTSLVRSARNCKSDLFPIIVLTMDSDCLGQEVVFFCIPWPADDFFRHDIWNRGGDGHTKQKNQGAFRALISSLLVRSTKNSHDCSSSAALDPPCLSSKATPLARTKVRYRLLMMPLDSLRSPLRRNHAWSHQSRHRSFRTPPQMCSQKCVMPLARVNLRMLKGL